MSISEETRQAQRIWTDRDEVRIRNAISFLVQVHLTELAVPSLTVSFSLRLGSRHQVEMTIVTKKLYERDILKRTIVTPTSACKGGLSNGQENQVSITSRALRRGTTEKQREANSRADDPSSSERYCRGARVPSFRVPSA